MKVERNIMTLLLISGITFGIVGQTSEAYASFWRNDRSHRREAVRHRRNQYPPARRGVYVSLPGGFLTVMVGGVRFHYRNGEYFRRNFWGYYGVSAPIGARVSSLPFGYEIIYIDGHPYYVYNNVYYNQTARGYVVVGRPQTIVVRKNVSVQKVVNVPADDAITLNIPNNKGGYTSVVIKRSGDGFIGPQGEYYESFPKVEQLKIVYGS